VPAPREPAAKPGWPVAALFAAALLPLLFYWQTTAYGFLLDDRVLYEKSASLGDWGSIADGFTRDLGALRKGTDTVNSSYYRPIFLALTTVYHQAAGGAPEDWHRLCVFLAALIGSLACLFFLRLGFSPWLALAGSAAFSLHPSHVGSIAWAAGLQELVAAAFVLLALIAALAWRDRPGSLWPGVLALLFYALALLSKEVAAGFLPFLALWAFAERRADPDAGRRLARLAAGALVLTTIYAGVRLAVLGGRLALPAEGAPGFLESLPAVPVALFTYLRLLLFPFEFSIFRPERPFHSLWSPAVLLAVAVLAGLGWLAARAIGRRRELLLPIAFFCSLLLPVLNLWVLDPQWMVTDRYLFLPSLALPWLVGLWLPRRPAIGLLAGLALVFAFFGLRYLAIFENERKFVAAMEIAEPTSPLIFTRKGELLAEDGDYAGAKAAFEKAAELDPIAPGPLEQLGNFALQEGDFAAAESFYRRVLTVRPYASRGFKLVALAHSRAGRHEEAARLVEEAARLWPEDFQVRLMEAAFLLHAGKRPAAEAAFAAAVRLRPEDQAVAGGFDAAMARFLPSLQLPAP
jgi:tetratricopeptide (TPR) repeat protein